LAKMAGSRFDEALLAGERIFGGRTGIPFDSSHNRIDIDYSSHRASIGSIDTILSAHSIHTNTYQQTSHPT